MTDIHRVVEKIKNVILGTHYEKNIYLVGGFVRNELMGIEQSDDIDILVDGNSVDAAIEFSKFLARKLNVREPVIFPTFGTSKLEIDGIDVECVTSRREKYDGISRKPLVEVGTLQSDAERRDFTVNAIFKRMSDGEILDLTGKGKDDLKNKVLRTTSDADLIFSEDPIRLIRLCRFAMKYDMEIPFSLVKSMKKAAKSLNRISKERIKDELNKILVLKSPSRAFRLFETVGILDVVIPELSKLVNLTQNKYHIDDAFRHTLKVLDGTPPDLEIRLGALFHDIGKAVTRTDKDGKIQFIGHDKIGAEITKEVLKRLKYSNEEIERISKIVKYHMDLKPFKDDIILMQEKHFRKFVYRVSDVLEPLLEVIHSDNNAHAELHNMPNQILKIKERLSKMNLPEILNTKSILDGDQIVALGAEGRLIGEIKSRILEKVLENASFSQKQAESLAKSLIADRKEKEKKNTNMGKNERK